MPDAIKVLIHSATPRRLSGVEVATLAVEALNVNSKTANIAI